MYSLSIVRVELNLTQSTPKNKIEKSAERKNMNVCLKVVILFQVNFLG